MHRILLVCHNEKSARTLEEMLGCVRDCQIVRARHLAQAGELLAQGPYSLLILNLPLPQEPEEPFLTQAAQSASCGILLLCPRENALDRMQRESSRGILVVEKPLSPALFCQAVCLGLSAHARLETLRRENRMLHSKIEELKLVSRAKAVLIEYLKLTEPQAHRYIEKQAMDLQLTRQQVAQNILKTYEL